MGQPTSTEDGLAEYMSIARFARMMKLLSMAAQKAVGSLGCGSWGSLETIGADGF